MNAPLVKAILALALILTLFSCNKGTKQFTVEGTITNADTLTLYLEKRGHSDIITLDSVKLDKEGHFKFKEDALNYTEFYRLKLENQNINFYIDSTETVKLNANKGTFATEYKVEDSPNNEQIKDVILSHSKFVQSINSLQNKYNNKIITNQQFINQVDTIITEYKNKTREFIFANINSPAAYYVLFQKVDDILIFNPEDKKDLQLFQAVGTNWNTYRESAPRSKQLNDFTLKAMANVKAEKDREDTYTKLMEKELVENKTYYEIALPDVDNKVISSTASKGKIILLDFTAYQTEYSLPHNIRLNKIYEKHKSKIEIYQVSFDEQKHAWQNAAINIPWIAVWDAQSLNSPLIGKFNIATLPTTFLLNRDGEIVKRLDISDNIDAEISKIL